MDAEALRRARAEKYGRLPERVKPADLVAEQPTAPVPDPDGGRDPERDFMLRYSA